MKTKNIFRMLLVAATLLMGANNVKAEDIASLSVNVSVNSYYPPVAVDIPQGTFANAQENQILLLEGRNMSSLQGVFAAQNDQNRLPIFAASSTTCEIELTADGASYLRGTSYLSFTGQGITITRITLKTPPSYEINGITTIWENENGQSLGWNGNFKLKKKWFANGNVNVGDVIRIYGINCNNNDHQVTLCVSDDGNNFSYLTERNVYTWNNFFDIVINQTILTGITTKNFIALQGQNFTVAEVQIVPSTELVYQSTGSATFYEDSNGRSLNYGANGGFYVSTWILNGAPDGTIVRLTGSATNNDPQIKLRDGNTDNDILDIRTVENGKVDLVFSSTILTQLKAYKYFRVVGQNFTTTKAEIIFDGGTPTTKTTPTLSFNTTTFNIAYGEVFTAPTATCSVEGLAISYTSSDDNIAEVNSSTGDVTIKKAGQVRITANTEETDTYNAASAYYDINIAKIVYNLAYSASTATAVIGESWTAPTLSNPSLLSVTYSSTNTNVATIDQNGNVEIVAAGETTIKAVYAGDDNYERLEASYVLTVSEQQQQPQPTANYITVDMGSYEYRTYVTTTNIDFSQSIGINGYYATGLTSDGTKVQFRKVTGVVAASVPLLLQKVSGATEYKLLTTDTSGSVPSPNKLVAGGTNSWISGSNIFVLTVHNGQLVFAETNINSANVNNEHAYLNLRGSNARSLMISFSDDEDEATEIDAIVSNEQDTQDIYDLRGLRVQKPTKGVYIINGKKMVIK